MANLYITEYQAIAAHGNIPAPQEPPVAEQNVSYDAATQSSAFNTATSFIRMVASADCFVAFGSDPTATADKQKLIAGVEYYRGVAPGHKVSVYDGSS